MFQKITEYLAWIFGCVLLGGMAFGWALSGEILKSLSGFFILCILGGVSVLYIIREVLYYANNKKDGQ